MTPILSCPECGAALPRDAPAGLCPKCLGRAALELVPAAGALENAVEEGSVLGRELPCRFGDYELIEEIARGGMGVVFRARQISLNRTVAVKMILSGQLASGRDVRRFRSEAESAAQLRHPNIVAIHEVGEREGQHYFSMEYVEGRNLADWVRDGPVGVVLATEWVRTLALAVHYAHEKGILHRDLKPANVLIDGKQEPRLTDFGLARRLSGDSDLTLSGQVLGSPNFMPPEQASGKHGQVGPASDVYSLGAILYYLVTGRPPFSAQSLQETLVQVRDHEPVAARLLNPGVPRDLETICQKCLEKDPRRRYGTAGELAAELDRYGAGEPILARPVGAPGRLWRWSNRNPKIAALSAALVLVFLGGFGAVLWQLDRVASSEALSRRHLYAADMILAAYTLEEHNIGRTLELLEKHRPQRRRPLETILPWAGLGGEDLRGWEWRYLWLQCQSDESFTVGKHSNCVTSVSVTPDGARLISGGWDHRVGVWDVAAHREVTNWWHDAPVYATACSPDGRWFATGSSDMRIAVWDAQSLRRDYVLTNDSPVQSLAFSPDSRTLASGDQAAVKLWDAASGRLLWTNAAPHNWLLPRGLAFSPDGQRLAFGDEKGHRVILWDLERQSIRTNFTGHTEIVHSLAFSPDGRMLASGAYDRTVRIWDLTSHAPVTNLTAFEGWVGTVAFSPDTNLLATVCTDQRIKLWDTRTWRELAVLKGHTNEVWSLAFFSDGQSFVTSSKDDTIRVWSASPDQKQPSIWPLPVLELWSVAFSPDATALIHATYTNEVDYISVRNTRTWQLQASLEVPFTNWIHYGAHALSHLSLAFGHGGTSMAVSGDDGTIALWDFNTKRVVSTASVETGLVRRMRFSEDGQFLAVGRGSNSVSVWRMADTNLIGAFPTRRARLMDATLSRDNRWMAAGYDDSAGEVWDVPGQRKWMDLTGHKSRLVVLAFSPDARLLATGAEDARVKLWDLIERREIATLSGQRMSIYVLAFDPEGRRLIGGGGDGRLLVWDITVRPPLQVAAFKASDHPLTAMAFEPDGDTLYTVALREGMRVWRAAPAGH